MISSSTATSDHLEGGEMDWAVAAVLIAVIFAAMVVITTYLSTHTKSR
jgi:hypothetical protein